MVSVLENPAVRARVAPFSVEFYHRLSELEGMANVELIRGAIVEKAPKSPRHASLVELLREHLQLLLPEGTFVRQEQPMPLLDSEPEPDLAVVPGTRQDFFAHHPHTASLVIEVAISSEALDRLILELYAEAGVPECWLILPEHRAVERHTQPIGTIYTQVESATLPQSLSSTVLPGLQIPPAGLFQA